MSQPAAAEYDEHSSFIKTPQQLLVILLLSFVVPIFGVVLTVKLVLGNQAPTPEALAADAVAARLQPVGKVEVIDVNAPKIVRTGEEITKLACAACHTTGAANAPKIGDKAGWAKLIVMGVDKLTASAIKGKNAMPPRGGVPDLSDYEIARAIVFMANQSGGSLKEPAAPTPAAAKPAAPAADAAKKK